MKTVLAATAVLALSASASFAACGHDMVKADKSEKVATLDMSTTASTQTDVEEDSAAPVKPD